MYSSFYDNYTEIIMRLIFLFPDNILSYNCFLCNGLCCNLNASLLFHKKQTEFINNFSYLDDYTNSRKGLYTVRCGKKCWFIKDDKCCLDDFCKPMDCSLYPCHLWKMDDLIFCEITPCPQMKLSKANYIKYSEIKLLSERYVKYLPLNKHPYYNKIIVKNYLESNEKLEIIKQWKLFLINDILEYQDENKKIVILLFTQLLAHPIIWNTIFTRLPEIFKTYCDNCDKYLFSYYADNIYNIYVLVRNETLKYVLNTHYYPINNSISDILSDKEKKLLKKYISSDGNGRLNYDIFKKFFEKSDTKWEAL